MKNIIKNNVPFLLMILFVYAGISKSLTFEEFRWQLHNQSFPGWMADILLYTLIPLELLAAALLCFARTEKTGLWLSSALLLAFTGYITLVMFHVWKRVPCSCGGILKNMSWGEHLIFNALFLLLALAALFVRREPSNKILT